jgi:alkyl hydroperoxide reductase subunit AhpC
MTIAVGDAIPDADVRLMRDGAPAVVPISELIGTGRAVLFAVPGAFTPTCHREHLPGYVERAAELSEKGVDFIVCLSVNDVFVMDAWGEAAGVDGSILMVADPDAAFTTAVGMDVDASKGGLGVRSKRYAMVVEDGVVTAFLPEPTGFALDASAASCVIDVLA